MKNAVKKLLAARGLVLARTSACDVVAKGNPRALDAVASLYELMQETAVRGLSDITDERLADLASLEGITTAQAVYLLALLEETRGLSGSVLEMGVAQGATSRMIARTIAEDERQFWLFDSFQGLPEPTEKDTLIDDIFNLGSMSAYAGQMSVPRILVEEKLRGIGFPQDRLHIIEGYFDETTSTNVELPKRVSFAFIDFDFYKPIKDALGYLADAVEPGGRVAVHEYEFFSTGPKTAIDEFLTEHGDRFELELPHRVARGMAILRRTDAHSVPETGTSAS